MMRKTLLAAVLTLTAMAAHADYKCSVTPRDDVILSPQTVQVKGENGNLVITPDGNVMYNGKQYTLSAAQREQAKDYQAELRSRAAVDLMRVPDRASKKAAWRWIKSSLKRWAKAATCVAV
ncbi:Uncharacterized protein YggN [Salmonella enterica subsp. enterica]|uniref:Uncharacterized protein YggN n=1 Tax=Salmonella enterica I TaxID=59201 RepID=A0A379WMV5_SALET|nr:Uncharacterized protein YggN [Salmonella enterica subsp. enterica]